MFYTTAVRCPRSADAEIVDELVPAATNVITQVIADGLGSRTCNSAFWLFRNSVNVAGRARRPDLVRAQFKAFGRFQVHLAPSSRWNEWADSTIRELGKVLIRCRMRPEAAELADRASSEWITAYRSGMAAALPTCLSIARLRYWLGSQESAEELMATVRPDWPALFRTRGAVPVACRYLEAIRYAPWSASQAHLRSLLDGLGRVPNTYTTHAHYSRSHLQVVDHAVIVIAARHFSPAADLLQTTPTPEIATRREALVEVRGKLVEWGQQDWAPIKSP